MSILKGFVNFGDSTITNHIQENLVTFLDYGLVEKSGYINVTIPTTGVYGGLDHKLRPVNDPRYSDGQVWESNRPNWVWETGVGALVSETPGSIGVSGVYVDNTFYPTSTSGTYAHHINHTLGRVVFDSPISLSSNVECEYSYKYVNITRADGLNWFKQIHKNSQRSDDSDFVSQTGYYATLSDNRYTLPAIGVELAPIRRMTPFQLGGGQTVFTDLLFHCVAEDVYTRDALIDVVCLQNQKVFNAYDLDQIATSGAFPIDYRGVPNSGAMTFPYLASKYSGNHIRLIDAKIDSIYSLSPDVHVGTVKITTECILFGV